MVVRRQQTTTSLDRHSLVPVLGKSGTHRPESGRPMQGVFILPTPLQFDAFCADLHRQALVAREQGVLAEEAPGDKITFDVCVRTPYVFEYSNGSLEMMTATEASRLLPGNPSLQIDMPQAPAPVIQLDVGHSLFETFFPQGSWGEILHEHPSQMFAAAPPVDVCSCKGFAVAEILPYLFEADMFVYYFLSFCAHPVIAYHVLFRPMLTIEVQISMWVEGL